MDEAPSPFETTFPHQQELHILGAPEVALSVLDLVFSTPEWIHRRSEHAEIVTASHARRRVTLDVTIPRHTGAFVEWFDEETYLLLPIDVPAKRPLVAFDICDEQDDPIPVLTQRQNGMVAWKAMEAYASRVVAPISPTLPSWASDLLRAVTQEAPEAALAAPPIMRGQQIEQSLGFAPTTIEFPVLSFMDCESFHFEATAPAGVDFIDIVLGDEHPDRTGDHVEGRWSLGYNRVLENSPHRAHLATSRTAHATARPDDFLDPHISVRVRIERDGWLRASSYASTIVFMFLVGSLPYIGTLGSDETRINTDPAAFAVAILAVLSLVVIQAGEHAYTARMVRALRLAATSSALLPIAAAWLLVFPGPGTLLTVGWWVLTAAAAVLSGTLWISRLLPVR